MKEKIRELVIKAGADVCGFASIDRFDSVEAGFGPLDIWPDCRTVICLGVALPKGLYCVPSRMIYARYNELVCDMADNVALRSVKEIEKLGITAVPLPSDGPYDYWDAEKKKGKGLVSIKEMAVECGLGSIGKNTMLINPKFGNRLNIGVIFIDYELESDPYAEDICIPGCTRCIENCPGHAIGENGRVNQLLCREQTYHQTERGFSVVDCNRCRTMCPVRFGAESHK